MASEFEFEGMDEFRAELQKAYEVYPDVTIKTMRAAGRVLRKSVVEETDAANVGELTGNLRKGYRFSMPTSGKGSYGMDITGFFRGETQRNPHMHLIEHGHRIVPRGKQKRDRRASKHQRDKWRETSGLGTTGAHMVENALDEFVPKFAGYAEAAMKRILKRAKL